MPNIEILQPKNCKFEDIKHDIQETPEKIVDIATYPNGFVMKIEQTADEIKLSSSKPFIKINESTFQIPES